MHSTSKKKLILIGLASTVIFAGAGAGGWALVNYYKENVKTPRQYLALAIEKKIIPLVNQEMNQYSAEWMSKYSTEQDFDFSSVEGYNPILKYSVVGKEPINQQLKITVKVSINQFESSEYETVVDNEFSTPESSSIVVVNQTFEVLPKYTEFIGVTKVPTIGSTITPESININSPDFTKNATGNFVYKKNGSIVSATKTLDKYSTPDLISVFITRFMEISNGEITEEQVRKDIESNIRNNNTVILFEINDGLPTNTKGTIIMKDFSNIDSSNFVENAPELSISLNDSIVIPTAAEVIKSIQENNYEKYLVFNGLPSTSNFRYDIVSGSVLEGDTKQQVLNLEVTITQMLNQNTKKYITTLSNLLSVQQNELNNIIANDPYNQYALKPIISQAYKGKTIAEILNSVGWSAFEFNPTELARYPGYDYKIVDAIEIRLDDVKAAISIQVEMVNKENSDVKYSYPLIITEGFI